MKTYTVGIVGGGIGGLFTGALLANKGYKVEVFEKNLIPGGYCQSFPRKKFSIHPAVLRIGSKSCKTMIDSYCEQANIGKIEWKTYNEYYQFGNEIKIDQCTPKMDDEIISYFPKFSEEIKKFFVDIRKLYDIMNKVFENNMTLRRLSVSEIKFYIPNLKRTAGEFVDIYFKDKVLKEIILAMLELDEKSVAMAIPMTYFEVKGQGQYYIPEGGAYSIIKKCINKIERAGGKIHKRGVVTKIEVENNKVTSIVSNEKKYEFDIIVSSMDINKTYFNLIGKNNLPKNRIINYLETSKWKISRSCFSVWIGLDDTLENLEIENGSIINYPNENSIAKIRRMMQTKGLELPEEYWCQIFTAFSGDESSTPKGKSQISVGLLIPYEYQNNWGSKNYKDVKKKLTNKIIMDLEKRYPKIKGKYIFIESATPLTYESWSGNTEGAYLGFEKYENLVYSRNRPQNQGVFRNLYFASHWVSVIGGVNGVMQESLKTANLILSDFPIENNNSFYDIYG